MKTTIPLLLLFSILSACNKEEEPIAFYILDRNILLEEEFSNNSNSWLLSTSIDEFQDSTSCIMENDKLSLYSYGYGYATASLDFSDLITTEIICFEIGVSKFYAPCDPYGDGMIPLGVSTMGLDMGNSFLYRPRSSKTLCITNSVLNIYIDLSANDFKVFENDTDISELFEFKIDFDSIIDYRITFGAHTDGEVESKTIVDYLIVYELKE